MLYNWQNDYPFNETMTTEQTNEVAKFVTRTLKVAILPKGDPIFSERCTTIEIDDQSGSEYLLITQNSNHNSVKEQEIQIDPDEWEPLKNAVEMMLSEIKKHSK